MDISETTAAKSDQQNYDDYVAGDRTVTISAVTEGSAEQRVNIELVEYPGRPFKPNLTMRRLLLRAWGKDTTTYVGRRMTLFGNPEVVWAGKAVGGVEIKSLSHIDKPLTVALTATRGKRKNFTVAVLTETKPRDWLSELTLAGDDLEAVASLGKAATDAHAAATDIAAIRARYDGLKVGA